jgi:hypothetical protein
MIEATKEEEKHRCRRGETLLKRREDVLKGRCQF